MLTVDLKRFHELMQQVCDLTNQLEAGKPADVSVMPKLMFEALKCGDWDFKALICNNISEEPNSPVNAEITRLIKESGIGKDLIAGFTLTA